MQERKLWGRLLQYLLKAQPSLVPLLCLEHCEQGLGMRLIIRASLELPDLNKS